MKYPKPDRSKYKPCFIKAAENPTIDIGWAEGVMRDGRPYRMECWSEDEVTGLTVFCSSSGIETMTNDQLRTLLEAEPLVVYLKPEKYHSVAGKLFTDDSGNSMWSINLVVGDDEDRFVGTIPLQPYPER